MDQVLMIDLKMMLKSEVMEIKYSGNAMKSHLQMESTRAETMIVIWYLPTVAGIHAFEQYRC
jgi:hypothetical protein